MSAGKRYVLDANVFIQAFRTHYAFGICPGFWSALRRQGAAKRVCSIDKIKGELVTENDDLSEWAKEKVSKTFFRGTADTRVVDTFTDMVRWVQNDGQFTPEAKAQFASVADGWLLAFAKVNRLVVVTHEEYAPGAKSRVPIPNVCIEFEVEYCDTFAMLRDVKEQFVLKTRRRKG